MCLAATLGLGDIAQVSPITALLLNTVRGLPPLVITLALLTAAAQHRWPRFPGSLALPCAAWLGVLVVSALAAAAHQAEAIDSLARPASGALLAWAVSAVCRTQRRWRLVLQTLALGGFAIAFIAVAEALRIPLVDDWLASVHDGAVPIGDVPRAAATLSHPNEAAMLLELTLPLLVACAWTAAPRWRPPLTLAALGTFLAIVLTFSRAGSIAAIVSLGLLAGLCVWRSSRTRLVTLGVVALAVPLAVGWASVMDPGLDRRLLAGVDESSTAQPPRTQFWSTALTMFSDHPLLGVGPDNFRWRFADYSGVAADNLGIHAHDQYLETLADTGVLGLATLLWLWVGVARVAGGQVLGVRVDPQRRAEKASRPFDKDRDGFVIGEGAGIVVLEELETREEARRADLRRAHRLRREQRRAPRRGAGARAQGRAGVLPRRARRREARPERDRVHQRARHLDRAQRQERDVRDQGRVRRSREEARDVVDQVDDGPHARCRRRHRGGHHRARDRARRAAADDRTTRRRIPSATSTTCRTQAREQRVEHAMSNSFGFGGTNAALDLEPLQGRLSMKWFAGSRSRRVSRSSSRWSRCSRAGRRGRSTSAPTTRSRSTIPTFGAEVGRRVVGDRGAFGLVVCGTGIGISIAANKVAGVRAALVHDGFTAETARAAQRRERDRARRARRSVRASPRRRCACFARRRSSVAATSGASIMIDRARRAELSRCAARSARPTRTRSSRRASRRMAARSAAAASARAASGASRRTSASRSRCRS